MRGLIHAALVLSTAFISGQAMAARTARGELRHVTIQPVASRAFVQEYRLAQKQRICAYLGCPGFMVVGIGF
jgi:hypothetical protein